MMMFRLGLLTLIVSLVGEVGAKTVHTSSGIVQGKEQDGVYQFLGIPFAEPPVGERRFAKPVWKSRMLGTYNATYFRPQCSQPILYFAFSDPNSKRDEDCLYLNIYSPLNAFLSELKTVMVWIHGGSYIFGSGQLFPGSILSQSNDVILVNVNYRLGALGFLSTDDDNAIGNYGLWDQTMALEWIKVNIVAFGGDPHSITIFGESAGSASVTQLAISPFTHGLFQRVIAESGTAFANWANFPTPLKAATDLGKRLGCLSDSTKELVHCLRQQSAEDIVLSQTYVKPDNAFSPTYKTDFLPYTPLELITTQINSTVSRKFAELDFIVGQNSDEGASFFSFFLGPILEAGEFIDDVAGISEQAYDAAIRAATVQGYPDIAEKIATTLKFMYTDWEKEADGITRSKMVIRLLSDSIFTPSIVQFARAHALLKKHLFPPNTTTSHTFMYLFDHRPSWLSNEAWRTGADHTDEISFVFGFPMVIPNVTALELQMTTFMMNYWTNFAKTGSPNNGAPVPVEWPTFEDETELYLRLHPGMTSPAESIGQRVFNDRVEFWLDYLPKQIAIYRQEPDPGQCRPA